jgi:hypothetical protein
LKRRSPAPLSTVFSRVELPIVQEAREAAAGFPAPSASRPILLSRPDDAISLLLAAKALVFCGFPLQPTPLTSLAREAQIGAETYLTVYFSNPGYYGPRLQVAGTAGPSSTISFTPAILATTSVPSAAPPAPSGVRASFVGVFPADPLDPTQTAPQPAFAITVASPSGSTLLGWNVYLSLDGGPWALVTALQPDLPAATPLRLPPWDPGYQSARIALAAVNWAVQGPLSAPITLTFPTSSLLEARLEDPNLGGREVPRPHHEFVPDRFLDYWPPDPSRRGGVELGSGQALPEPAVPEER